MSRYGKTFGDFLWDFIVGEAPEMAVGIVVILGIALALGKGERTGVYLLPVLVVLLLAGSIFYARSRIRQ